MKEFRSKSNRENRSKSTNKSNNKTTPKSRNKGSNKGKKSTSVINGAIVSGVILLVIAISISILFRHQPIENIKPDTNRQFVDKILIEASLDEKQTGIPTAVTVAQAVLESGYGKSVPIDVKTKRNSYNLFGIKGKGTMGSVTCATQEYLSGSYYTIKSDFAAYKSYFESINEHSKFLKKNSRYQGLFKLKTPEEWAVALQKAGYATDPEYSKKLITIMKTWNLVGDRKRSPLE